MGYIWAVLFALGVLVGAVLWVGMAIVDGVRGLFRRVSGELDETDNLSQK